MKTTSTHADQKMHLATSSNPAYSAQFAAELVTLATLANQSMTNLYLPDDWKILYTHTASSMYGGSQYFLAAHFGSATDPSPTMCALVVGAKWSDFISFYTPDNYQPSPVSSKIIGNDVNEACADTGFTFMYSAIRTALWVNIAAIRQTIPAFVSSLPMTVVGIGPGAALAQLASLDLRPGKTVAPSLVTSLQSYVFSCPAFADNRFAALFATTVPAGYRVQAQADFFPFQPANANAYVQAGVLQSLPVVIPTYDSPWVERDGPYYNQLLCPGAAETVCADQFRGNEVAGAAGYSQALAFAMAKLSAVAYQMYQNPGSTVQFAYNPYVLKANIQVNDTVWASVFEGPDALAIAFRGTVSWLELISLTSNAYPATPAWLSGGYGQYAMPLVNLYASGRDTLRAQLTALGNKPVLLTGHNCGGALANLMAVDMLQHPLQGNRSVQRVYTFGTPPAASNPFVTSYMASSLGPVSYQVVRPRDIVPALPLLGFLFTLGTPVTLPGGEFEPYNGSTFHGLITYLDLLSTNTGK